MNRKSIRLTFSDSSIDWPTAFSRALILLMSVSAPLVVAFFIIALMSCC